MGNEKVYAFSATQTLAALDASCQQETIEVAKPLKAE